MPQPRPTGVTVLAALATISATLSLLAMLGVFGPVAGAIPIGWILTFLSIAAAYGLWNLRPWAWWLSLIVWIIGTLDAIVLLTNGTFNTNLIVGPIVVLYLLRSDIQAAFGRGPRTS